MEGKVAMKVKRGVVPVLPALLLVGVFLFFPARGRGEEVSEYGNPLVWVTVERVQLQAELVKTPAKCYLGLSFRRDLPEGRGMLFLLPRVEPQTFCMRGMQFPIDIIWIGDGRVAGVEKNVSPEFTGELPSPVPVQVVLEVPGGFADRHGIRRGDRVHWGKPEPGP